MSTRQEPAVGNDGTASSTKPATETASPRVVDSNVLLEGQTQLAILHNKTIYILRQTRLGKLILTK